MNRTQMIQRMGDSSILWDVLVIGGGATGLGTALEAASRGLRTALVEAADFTQGTSSRSTKLIHGGVRYLQNMQIGMVRESLYERGNLLRNAPGLVRPLDFCIPCHSKFEQAYYYAGLKAYDLLAGRQPVASSRWLSRAQTLHQLPSLAPPTICGGVQYSDAQFDDARLGLAIARTAAEQSACLANHAQVRKVDASATEATTTVRDQLSGQEFQIRSKTIVNATGVFAEKVLQLAGSSSNPSESVEILPSRGSHIVLDRSFLPGQTALLLPKTDDGRVLFVIPWYGSTLVGTTDVETSEIELNPSPTLSEVDYLLEHAGKILQKQPTRRDVKSVFAGLRPLVKPKTAGSSSKASREHLIHSDRCIVSIIGGKWTTYRKMGEDVVNRLEAMLDRPRSESKTHTLELHGGGGAEGSELQSPPALDEAFVKNACQHEMACTVDDVLARRSRLLFVDAAEAVRQAPKVAKLMACELGHSDGWQLEQIERFQKSARQFSLPSS